MRAAARVVGSGQPWVVFTSWSSGTESSSSVSLLPSRSSSQAACETATREPINTHKRPSGSEVRADM